ncbi:MAG: FecR family protein [Alphaproteobacteria bacterium]
MLALVPVAAQAAPDRVEQDDYWRVVEVTGEATMLQGANPWNAPAPLQVGDVVGPYQSIATQGGASAILSRGQDVIVVYENTTIELPPPAPDQAETQIVQAEGEAFYSVEPRPDPHFAVETPYLIAGVKGTEFALTGGGTRLEVARGLVDAEDLGTGQHADVPAGTGVGAGAAGAQMRVAALDTAAMERWNAVSQDVAEASESWAETVADAAADEAHDATEASGNGNSGGNGNGNSGGNGNGNSGGNGNGIPVATATAIPAATATAIPAATATAIPAATATATAERQRQFRRQRQRQFRRQRQRQRQRKRKRQQLIAAAASPVLRS